MTRVSVKEAYSNRDLIAQISRLKTYVEQGTFKEVSTSYSGGVLVLTFTAYDDSTQSFNIPMDSIVGITGDQVGNTVTLHVEFASGTVVDIPYTIANADTSPTPDTLGLRDANGKLFAADPASGATDKTLVTANWISQTGDSSPNNVVHRTGNETVAGSKTFNNFIVGESKFSRYLSSSTNSGKWVRVGTIVSNALHFHASVYYSYGIAEITSKMDAIYLTYKIAQYSTPPSVALVKEADGTFTLWWQHPGNYATSYFVGTMACRYSGGDMSYFTPSTDDSVESAPIVGIGATLYNAQILQ